MAAEEGLFCASGRNGVSDCVNSSSAGLSCSSIIVSRRSAACVKGVSWMDERRRKGSGVSHWEAPVFALT